VPAMTSSFDRQSALPPFDSLPEESRGAIVRAIARDDRWRMAGYEIGNAHAAATRALRWLAPRAASRGLSGILPLLISTVQSGPARLIHGAFRAWRRVSSDSRALAGVSEVGIEPRELAVRYARGIPQAPAFRGYWHDPSRHNTVGVVLGIDFIPDPDGYWFVESNLDAALRPERSDLYDRDPFVTRLAGFAASRGYARLVVVPGNTVRLDSRMAAQCEEETSRRGVSLTIADDKFLPGATSRTLGIPPLTEGGTFVARIRRYHTALDHLLCNKRAADRALRLYLAESGDRTFRLPATGAFPEVFRPAADEPYPNVVYKCAEMDSGLAVAFLKVESPGSPEAVVEEAMRAVRPRGLTAALAYRLGRRTGLFQSYVRSVPTQDRRLFIIRAHVLVSPAGNQFLSAHRVVASAPVPQKLAFGLVRDPRPYLVNFAAGARYEVVSRDEEESASRAAMAVAGAFSRALELGFETGLVDPADERSSGADERRRGGAASRGLERI